MTDDKPVTGDKPKKELREGELRAQLDQSRKDNLRRLAEYGSTLPASMTSPVGNEAGNAGASLENGDIHPQIGASPELGGDGGGAGGAGGDIHPQIDAGPERTLDDIAKLRKELQEDVASDSNTDVLEEKLKPKGLPGIPRPER